MIQAFIILLLITIYILFLRGEYYRWRYHQMIARRREDMMADLIEQYEDLP